jgi:hypothetical protein
LVLMEIGSKLETVFSEDHRRRILVFPIFVLKHFRTLELKVLLRE